MDLKNLQQELLEIIFLILAPDSAEEEKDMKDRALKIIDELKDHINDEVEYNSQKMTVLDYTIFCDTQGYHSNNSTRINNPALLELETVIRDAGGQTSQELERNANSFPRRPENVIRAPQIMVVETLLEDVTIAPAMRNDRLLMV